MYMYLGSRELEFAIYIFVYHYDIIHQ